MMADNTMKYATYTVVLLLLNGVCFSASKECTVESQYTCVTDCNCRYNSNIVRRVLAFFDKICDPCEELCTKEKQIKCSNGLCDKKKGCVCHDCWIGEACSEYENKNNPKFIEKPYMAEIYDGINIGDPIIQVSATDRDLETCVNKNDCPCGNIIYYITKGNENGYFYIDEANGIISLQKRLPDENSYELPFVLRVSANNSGQESKPSQTFVVVSISKAKANTLIRRRRSARQVYTPLITVFEADTNETFFNFSATVPFNLTMYHNQSGSPETLSNVKILLTATNLKIDKNSVTVAISGVTMPQGITVLDLNTAINVSFAHVIGTSDSLEILFQATVTTEQPLSTLQVSFSMHATAALNDVSYGPVNSKAVYTVYPQTCFIMNPVAENTQVETTMNYDINITLPTSNFSLTIEISTAINEIAFLSIESIPKVEISDTVTAGYPNPVPVKYSNIDGVTYRVLLNFGYVKATDVSQNKNKIEISFTVKVNDHPLLENNTVHWIGVGMSSGEDMVWIGQQPITIIKDVPYLIAYITAVNDTAPTRYYKNDILQLIWNVTHANVSYQDAENPKIVFDMANSTTYVSHTIDQTATLKQIITTNGRTGIELTLATPTFPRGSVITGTFTVNVKDTTLLPLEDLSTHIQIHYQTSSFTNRPVKTYKPEPGYSAGIPLFNLTANCSDRTLKIGQVVEFTLDIVFTRISLSGEIEFVFPVVNTSLPIMLYADGSLSTTYGTNLERTGIVNPTVSVYSTINETGSYNRGSLELGEVNNNDLSESALSNEENNKLTVTFQGLIDDTPYVTNGTDYWVGVGVRGGTKMVWVGSLAFIAIVSPNRRPKLKIEANKNGTYMLQGATVQYNATILHDVDSEAHAYEVELLWMLPTYTKFQTVLENTHNMQFSTSDDNILFKLDKLKFLEKPFISFTVTLDPEKKLKVGKNYAVTPIALTYKNNITQETIYEPLMPMSVEFRVPYPATQSSENALTEFYDQGYITEPTTSEIYFCNVAIKRHEPSCFQSANKGDEWRAVDVLVVNIIGFEKNNGFVFGIGNNKKSYMKYIPNYGKWFAVTKEHWMNAKPTMTTATVIRIENTHLNEGSPESSKTTSLASGDEWGANINGIYFKKNGEVTWKQKALWQN